MKKIGVVTAIIVAVLTVFSILLELYPELKQSLHLQEAPTVAPVGKKTTDIRPSISPAFAIKPSEVPPTESTAADSDDKSARPRPKDLSEVVPEETMVGRMYPLCGEFDVVPTYYKMGGTEVEGYIPSCYQINITLVETNLFIYEILEDRGDWLHIRMNFNQQIYRRDELENGRPNLMEFSTWIHKDQAFTAWTIHDGNKKYLLQSITPTAITKNENGTWSVTSGAGCLEATELKPQGGNNLTEAGLQMNVNYDPSRDCGT